MSGGSGGAPNPAMSPETAHPWVGLKPMTPQHLTGLRGELPGALDIAAGSSILGNVKNVQASTRLPGTPPCGEDPGQAAVTEDLASLESVQPRDTLSRVPCP